MKFKIIRKAHQSISAWTGGTTTELFIFPVDASYPKRDFLFRLSSATIEAESSVFTSLPGFSRILMILDGVIEISHQEKYSKILSKSDQDHFDGSWKTTSTGRAIDFNLMMVNGLHGLVEMMLLAENEKKFFRTAQNSGFTGIYVFLGTTFLNIDNESVILDTGDFAIIEKLNTEEMEITAPKAAEIILSSIQTADNADHPFPWLHTLPLHGGSN